MQLDKPKLRLGLVFSGIGAIEYTLIRLGIDYEAVVACDNDPHVKKSYFGNYEFSEQNWYDDITDIDGRIFRK